MNYIAGSDRSEVLLLPEVLDDYIAAENAVRFIDALVGQLDLHKAGFTNAAETNSHLSSSPNLHPLPLWFRLRRVKGQPVSAHDPKPKDQQ